MNNFGIFKLLSSLYGYYNRNKEQFPLSSLLSFGGNKNATATTVSQSNSEENNNKSASEKTETAPRLAPINRQMLATMTSHDDFVKRVLKNATNSPRATTVSPHTVRQENDILKK